MTSEPHHHRAFGWAIRSRLPLPPLPFAEPGDLGDVEIEYGAVPEHLSGGATRAALFEAAPGALLLRVPGVARFLVTAGRRVVIDPAPGSEEELLRAFVLAPVFGALAHQRGEIALHGSAVVHRAGAVAFLGLSGAGKSTLAAEFRRRGCPVLTDDHCVVRPDVAGRAEVQPGFPLLKLALDALARLDVTPAGLRRLRTDEDKQALLLEADFARAPAPLRKIYVLFPGLRADVQLEPVAGQRVFQLLKSHTYRPDFLASAGDRTAGFEKMLRLAQHARVAIVHRPKGQPRFEDVLALLEADLAQ